MKNKLLVFIFFLNFCAVSCFGKNIKDISISGFLQTYDSIPDKNEKEQFLQIYLDTVVFKSERVFFTTNIDMLYEKGVLNTISESDKNKLTHIILTNRLYDVTMEYYCHHGVDYLSDNMTGVVKDSIRKHFTQYISGTEEGWKRNWENTYDVELNYGKILLQIGDDDFCNSVFKEVRYHFPSDKVIYRDSINNKTCLFFKTVEQKDIYYKGHQKELCDLLIFLIENYSNSYCFDEEKYALICRVEYFSLFDVVTTILSKYIEGFPTKEVRIVCEKDNSITIFGYTQPHYKDGICYHDINEDYKKEVLKWCSQHRNDYKLKN